MIKRNMYLIKNALLVILFAFLLTSCKDYTEGDYTHTGTITITYNNGDVQVSPFDVKTDSDYFVVDYDEFSDGWKTIYTDNLEILFHRDGDRYSHELGRGVRNYKVTDYKCTPGFKNE